MVFVTDGTGQNVSAGRSVSIANNPVLELSMTEDLDPVAPSGLLTYTLNFGNRSLGIGSQNAVLLMPTPIGTTFVSATGGGLETSGNVEWTLGSIGAGESGTRQLTVQVASDASEGEVSKAEAAVTDTSILVNESRASAVTRVQSSSLLSLSITANPDPVRPNETLNVSYTVTNLSGTTRFSVVLQARVPDDVNFSSDSLITGGGDCLGSTCDRREIITWDIGTLAVGETRTETIPPVVSSSIPEGTIIQFMVFVFDGTDSRSDAAKAVIISNRPDITIDNLNKSFGGVMVGFSSDQTITVSNDGSADLVIDTVAQWMTFKCCSETSLRTILRIRLLRLPMTAMQIS